MKCYSIFIAIIKSKFFFSVWIISLILSDISYYKHVNKKTLSEMPATLKCFFLAECEVFVPSPIVYCPSIYLKKNCVISSYNRNYKDIIMW